MRRIIYFSVLLILFQNIDAQNKLDLSSAVYSLSNYLISNEFNSLSKNKTDLEKIDLLYLKSLQINDNDYSEALLTLTFATLPFNKIKLHVPIFGIKINIPLPSTNDSLFRAKLKNTPRQLFFDSPKNKSGDIDKIAHFFGNAFLSYNVSWIHLSEFLGLLVESFESEFKIAGSFDKRDLFVNKLGSAFGVALKKNLKLLPSQFFEIYNLLFINTNFY